jgi:hypothetical protein
MFLKKNFSSSKVAYPAGIRKLFRLIEKGKGDSLPKVFQITDRQFHDAILVTPGTRWLNGRTISERQAMRFNSFQGKYRLRVSLY